MTPNGAVLFTLVVMAGAMLSQHLAALLLMLAVCLAFGVIEIRQHLLKAVAWALAFVALVCLRLTVIALVVPLLVQRFAHLTPLQFVRALTFPLAAKRLLALTLSFIDTFLHAVERARTALITAGVVTPRLSLTNATQGWILVQTVWLSVVTIAIGRLRDKWPTEQTLARLDHVLLGPAPSLTIKDGVWIGLALATVALAGLL